jgi:hypothetical protein
VKAAHEVGDESGDELLVDRLVRDHQPVVAGASELVDQDAGVGVGS